MTENEKTAGDIAHNILLALGRDGWRVMRDGGISDMEKWASHHIAEAIAAALSRTEAAMLRRAGDEPNGARVLKCLKWVGYAPGTYYVKCGECGVKHIADKRASRCIACADKAVCASLDAAVEIAASADARAALSEKTLPVSEAERETNDPN
jgi:hypothetical protein